MTNITELQTLRCSFLCIFLLAFSILFRLFCKYFLKLKYNSIISPCLFLPLISPMFHCSRIYGLFFFSWENWMSKCRRLKLGQYPPSLKNLTPKMGLIWSLCVLLLCANQRGWMSWHVAPAQENMCWQIEML